MDAAEQTLLETAPALVTGAPLARPRAQTLARAEPEMNREDRVIFTAYLAMIVLLVAFLAVAGMAAALGG